MKTCDGCGNRLCMEPQDFESLGKYVHGVETARACWEKLAAKAASLASALNGISKELDRDVPELDTLGLTGQMAEITQLYKDMLEACWSVNEVAKAAKRQSFLMPPALAGLQARHRL